MRVISGKSRGHQLKSPKGNIARPTEDRIKESLFNILGTIKTDALVLDLFAGSGAIGIEFLSRGAQKAYFIDHSYSCIQIIKENLMHTKLLENAIIYKKDSIDAISFFKNNNISFDYIYIDPPFQNHNLLFSILDSLKKHDILKNDGIIIIEHERGLELYKEIDGFKINDFRNYGNKSITFLQST